MPFEWPGAFTTGGDLPVGVQNVARQEIERFAAIVEAKLGEVGLPVHASPLFRQCSILVVRDLSGFHVALSPASSMPTVLWLDQSQLGVVSTAAVEKWAKEVQGWDVATAFWVLDPARTGADEAMNHSADRHVQDIERQYALGKLGDLTGVAHLEPHFRAFLEAHPDPDRNVFVMMRFLKSDQLTEVYETIKKTLAERGLHAVRADDREYTDELWSNVQVYLTCCKYGIAVFEDIDARDFNPNVSLELGYMLAQHKRTLILKEQRLPRLPTDVVARLYKSWDVFRIAETVGTEVARWVDVDLEIKPKHVITAAAPPGSTPVETAPLETGSSDDA